MDFNDLTFDSDSSSIKISGDDFKVYAHKNELLTEHIDKTLYFFHQLVDSNVLFNLYCFLIMNKYINLNFDEFNKIIELYISFHDVGKISFNFQLNKLNRDNNNVRISQYEVLSRNNLVNMIKQFSDKHAFSSSLCFLSKNLDILNENSLFIFSLVYSINSHHTYLKDFSKEEGFTYNQFDDNEEETLYYLLVFLNIATRDKLEKYNPYLFNTIQTNIISTLNDSNSIISFFYNYMYSLLISADVLASSKYDSSVSEIKSDYKNIINHDLKVKMRSSFYDVEYNKNIECENYIHDFSKIDNLDDLRRNMLLESSFNLKNNMDNRVFFLNMPTGGGKTNTSMKLALDLIENTDANRIIYSMPFINIIEQNYGIVKDNFGLNEDIGEIRKIYSATETLFNDEDDEFKSKVILQDSFFNYPVIFTTFSTFFDAILRTKKRYKYKIASYVNSVVILDEIQSLPIKNWNSLYYLINEMVEKYNMYFIIMSATLPKFDKLKLDYNNKYKHKKPFQLIKNPEKYFNHFLFDRTEIKNDLKELSLENIGEIKEFLQDIVDDNFNQGYNKGLIVLNTIRSSKIIYDILKESYPDLNINLLNSSLLSNVKKEIIYSINNMGNDDSRYLLVSTQSIEAGVDVSFDFVIRDFAILDSIEQVRGRCNRSRELNSVNPYKKGNIYLMNLSDKQNKLYEHIYNEIELESRIKETKNILNKSVNYNYSDIINYYDNVSENVNNLEDKKHDNFVSTDRNNISNWNLVHYYNLQDDDGIHIIDDNLNQFSIFIPTKMYIFTENLDELFNVEKNLEDLKKIYDDDKNRFIFSYNELEFLKSKQDSSEYKFIIDNYIDGEELIKFYKKYIDSFKKDFNQYHIVKKEFSSIINKFIINIVINNREVVSMINEEYDKNFEKFGYFYIMDSSLIGDDEYSLYSLRNGLNDNFFHVEIL